MRKQIKSGTKNTQLTRLKLLVRSMGWCGVWRKVHCLSQLCRSKHAKKNENTTTSYWGQVWIFPKQGTWAVEIKSIGSPWKIPRVFPQSKRVSCDEAGMCFASENCAAVNFYRQLRHAMPECLFVEQFVKQGEVSGVHWAKFSLSAREF